MKALERRASALFGKLSSVLRALSKDTDPKDVHHLRTSARRLESTLTLLHVELTPKQRVTLKELEKLRRRAGKVRDCDIQIGLLDEIANGSTRADRETVAKSLRTKRSKQAKRLASEVEEFLDSKAPDRLRKIASRLRAQVAEMLPGQPLADAGLALDALRQSSRTQDLRKPPELHGLRLQFKKARYLAELASPSAEQKKFLETLKSVQDAIGRWHDWESLALIAGKTLQHKPGCSLLAEIDALHSSYRRTAIDAAKRLLHPPTLPAKKEAASSPDAYHRVQTAG